MAWQSEEQAGSTAPGLERQSQVREVISSRKLPHVELIYWKPRSSLAWDTNEQYKAFPRERAISSLFIYLEDLGFSFLLADRELTDRTVELPQELTVAWKLNHIPPHPRNEKESATGGSPVS